MSEPKTEKARVHLDLSAADLDATTQRIRLGRELVGRGADDGRVHVALVPGLEGNEFDVLLA